MAGFETNNSFAFQASQVQRYLAQFFGALAALQASQKWAAGRSIEDLIKLGAPPDPVTPALSPDAQALKDCLADAEGMIALITTGTDPRGVPAGYDYTLSMRNVAGVRT